MTRGPKTYGGRQINRNIQSVWLYACDTSTRRKRAPGDAKRVNVNEIYEVQYWTKKFGCTTEQLKVAVKKVGVIVADGSRLITT